MEKSSTKTHTVSKSVETSQEPVQTSPPVTTTHHSHTVAVASVLFGIMIFSIILSSVVGDALGTGFQGLFVLIYFGCAVATFVYSIILIRMKKLGLGITYLVISSIVLLLIVIAFLVGFMIGLSQIANSGELTGNVVSNSMY